MPLPLQLNDDLRLYPPSPELVDDGCPPREAAQWSVQETDGRTRPLSLADAIELVGDEHRLVLVSEHLDALRRSYTRAASYLEQFGEDVDHEDADEFVIALVKLGQFAEQATHDLSRAPVGAELV